MKERPILFSAPMVRAILAGRKTQTRRVARRLGVYTEAGRVVDLVPLDPDGDPIDRPVHCPYGAPGDRLWVRETFALSIRDPDSVLERDAKDPTCWDGAVYRATYSGGDWENYAADGTRTKIAPPWRPSTHMPRWASRLTLEVTAVRVERLQDITEEDARAEGCFVDEAEHGPCDDQARDVFLDLWDRINGKRAPWSSNPWVWVVSFRRVAP